MGRSGPVRAEWTGSTWFGPVRSYTTEGKLQSRALITAAKTHTGYDPVFCEDGRVKYVRLAHFMAILKKSINDTCSFTACQLSTYLFSFIFHVCTFADVF